MTTLADSSLDTWTEIQAEAAKLGTKMEPQDVVGRLDYIAEHDAILDEMGIEKKEHTCHHAARLIEHLTKCLSDETKDAERWRKARKFLAVEDIDRWAGPEWKGHQPDEAESQMADRVIDALEAP